MSKFSVKVKFNLSDLKDSDFWEKLYQIYEYYDDSIISRYKNEHNQVIEQEFLTISDLKDFFYDKNYNVGSIIFTNNRIRDIYRSLNEF